MSHAIVEDVLEGIPIVTLRGPELSASFAPSAGMIGCSLEHVGAELLGRRRGLEHYAETGSTMGIPLLAPWANRLPADRLEVLGREVRLDGCPERVRREENGLPIHGLVSASPDWRVEAAEADQGGARLRASLDVDLPCFPFPHRLEVEAVLGDTDLEVRTRLEATGGVGVPLCFGWHPYFTLPGVRREDFELELPVRRRVVLDGRGLPTGETEGVEPVAGPLGSATWDDCFDRVEPGRPFVLAGGGRRIEARFGDGYPVAQVFAPPGSDFVCFEPMAAPVAALATPGAFRVVEPGEHASADFAVRVTAA